jgi:hypothetical protein
MDKSLNLETALEEMVKEKGRSILRDRRAYASLLSDYLPDNNRDHVLALHALDSGAPASLEEAGAQGPHRLPLVVEACTAKLLREYPLTPEDARRVIEALARAMGLPVTPVDRSRKTEDRPHPPAEEPRTASPTRPRKVVPTEPAPRSEAPSQAKEEPSNTQTLGSLFAFLGLPIAHFGALYFAKDLFGTDSLKSGQLLPFWLLGPLLMGLIGAVVGRLLDGLGRR